MKSEANYSKTIIPEFVKLGLSIDTSRCYLALFQSGPLSSKDIANHVGILPNVVYRITKTLIDKGFIVQLDTYPKTFQAIPFEIAIKSLIHKKIHDLEKSQLSLIASLKQHPDSINQQTKVDILTGRDTMMSTYVELAKKSNKEILIISIGEPVSDDIKLVNRDLLEQGISIKFIVHTYNESNQNLLRSWIKMGLEVRYMKDWGYHLVIFDENTSILSTNNPKNTEERTSMVIHSSGLSHALRTYFFTVWKNALPITAQ